MATKAQKVDFIYKNFTFKGGMTKKKLSMYPEEALDKLINDHKKDFEAWINRPKMIKYLVEGEKDGQRYTWEWDAADEKDLLKQLKSDGITPGKFVTKKGNHICMYCQGIAEGTQKDILCSECRETFGHYSYNEL